jgi:hypothetical protein
LAGFRATITVVQAARRSFDRHRSSRRSQAADLRFSAEPSARAGGVWFYRLSDLVDARARPCSCASRARSGRLHSALAQDEGTETVVDISRRRKAIAAINAGFFAPNGDPSGLLKVNGELVSEMMRPRGAVAISGPGARSLQLLFDRVTAQVSVSFDTPDGQQVVVEASINGVRQRDALTVYTPRFHEDTATAGAGVEGWQNRRWSGAARPRDHGSRRRHRASAGSTAGGAERWRERCDQLLPNRGRRQLAWESTTTRRRRRVAGEGRSRSRTGRWRIAPGLVPSDIRGP